MTRTLDQKMIRFILPALPLTISSLVYGQSIDGRILGTVFDPSGATDVHLEVGAASKTVVVHSAGPLVESTIEICFTAASMA